MVENWGKGPDGKVMLEGVLENPWNRPHPKNCLRKSCDNPPYDGKLFPVLCIPTDNRARV
jgi:hypothetical protein